jgi:hypothetical protein
VPLEILLDCVDNAAVLLGLTALEVITPVEFADVSKRVEEDADDEAFDTAATQPTEGLLFAKPSIGWAYA